jgi:hypothetical protein
VYDSVRFDAMKKTLIYQYHSQLMAHAGYIIALIIGSLTIISRIDSFLTFGIAGVLSIFVLISAIIGLITYFASRLFYWNCLECLCLSVKEKTFLDYHKANVSRCACLANLQLLLAKETIDVVRKRPVTISNRIACRSIKRQAIDSALVGSLVFVYLFYFGYITYF